MIHDPRPIVPMNPEGLDELASKLLEGVIVPKAAAPSDLPNPESCILLEGRQHGAYSYPDLLVRTHRLGYTDTVGKVAQTLGLTVKNTAQEQDGSQYIGSIQQKQAIDLVKGLNYVPLTMRLHVDFLKEINSGREGKRVFDGNGNNVSRKDLEQIWNEITEVRNPWRAEWLDNRFSKKGKQWYVTYHQIQQDGTLNEVTEALEECLMIDKTPGIDLRDWLNRATTQGLPPSNVIDGTMYYRRPQDGAVAWFGADSDRAFLNGSRDLQDSYSALGVRVAKIKA